MKCPVCGTGLPLQSDRCPACGYHGPVARPQTTVQTPIQNTGIPYDPPNKTSRGKCCCCAAAVIVPLVLLLVATLVIGINFIATSFPFEEFEYESEAIAPDRTPESLPQAAGEDCFTIRGGVLSFLPDAWEGGTILRIPETVAGQTVTAIGPGCFRDCRELTTIILPDTVTEIGPEAFSGCTQLRGIQFPTGMEVIGSDAFDGCANIESIYIPITVTEIASGTFEDCAGLLYIFYEGTFEEWAELYSDFITPFTLALCQDGAYYHGVKE